jgi:hypothetical protein
MATERILVKAVGGLAVVRFVAATVVAARAVWNARRDRPWMAFSATPLAMTAGALVGLWWTWLPLLLCACIWSRAWRWSWLLTLQLGIVGAEWAYIGATALAQWPDLRIFVGLIWASIPLALAMAGIANREYHNLPERGLRL